MSVPAALAVVTDFSGWITMLCFISLEMVKFAKIVKCHQD